MERAPVRSQLEVMLWPSRWWSDGMGARGAEVYFTAGAFLAYFTVPASTEWLRTVLLATLSWG